MPKRKTITLASAGAALLIGSLATAAFAVKKDQRAWICGKKSDYPTYILKSGDEYIVANPSDTYSDANSRLISFQQENIPKKWLPDGVIKSSVKSDKDGFSYTSEYSGERGDASKTKTSFAAKQGLLTYSYPGTKNVPNTTRCNPLVWTDVQSDLQSLSGVPVIYLSKRNQLFEPLNPKLGQPDFNVFLANSLVDAPKSDYSVYKLLSVLPREKLKTEQLDQMDQAKKNLIVSTSSQQAFWEYENDFTYNYNGEVWKQMAEEAARLKCNNENENSSATLLSEGYEIVSSVPQVKEFGWMKHTFEDGSWVSYKVDCKGKYFVMKKEGFID